MANKFYPPNSQLHQVPANRTSLIVSDLERFALYKVIMWTEGLNAGKSLPTYEAKVVTHIEGEQAESRATYSPVLPDIKECCMEKNVSHSM